MLVVLKRTGQRIRVEVQAWMLEHRAQDFFFG